MPDRDRVKGQGVDIFFGGKKSISKKKTERTGKPAYQQAGEVEKAKTEKATFYLPEDIANEIDKVWIDLRRRHRDKKVTKSKLVRIALEQALRDPKRLEREL